MPEAVTHRQRLSISYAISPLEINFEDVKFTRVISQSTGIAVPNTSLLLGRQMVTK
jgi:hypothetical protein